MSQAERIADAGNTIVPCILALRSMGFTVRTEEVENRVLWKAESSLLRFIADDPVALLGLVAMRESRGQHWKAADDEIDAAMEEFHLE